MCERVEKLVRKVFDTKTIDKIVAFGGGSFVGPYQPDEDELTASHSQHAILLVMQNVWKEFNPNKELSIYIQDLKYYGFDEEVANLYGMTVVNGSIGHQKGWTLLDESTFLVDLGACFPITTLALEITRPAAIFSPYCFEKIDLANPLPSILTLKHNGEEVKIPTPGYVSFLIFFLFALSH